MIEQYEKLKNGTVPLACQVLFDDRLTPLQVRVYAALLRFRNMKDTRETGLVTVTETGLADLLGCSRARVSKSVKALAKVGYVKVHTATGGRGKSATNRYELCDLESVPFPVCQKVTPKEFRCALPEVSVCPTVSESIPVGVPSISTSQKSLLEQVTLSPKAPAKERARKKRAPDSHSSASPAALFLEELTETKTVPVQRVAIDAVVTDLERWKVTVSKWVLSGLSAHNVQGMLDWYREPSRVYGDKTLEARQDDHGDRSQYFSDVVGKRKLRGVKRWTEADGRLALYELDFGGQSFVNVGPESGVYAEFGAPDGGLEDSFEFPVGSRAYRMAECYRKDFEARGGVIVTEVLEA